MIGGLYRYMDDSTLFKLKEVRGYIYLFECGHRCTDLVFMDMVPAKVQLQMDLK